MQLGVPYVVSLAAWLWTAQPVFCQFATGSQTGSVGVPQYLLPIVRSSESINTSDLLEENEDADAGMFRREVLESKGTVVVEWMSPDCPACAPVRPVIEELSADFGDKVHVVRINIHKNPYLTYKYGIRRVPAVTVFTDGKPVERLALFNPAKKHQLSTIIERQL